MTMKSRRMTSITNYSNPEIQTTTANVANVNTPIFRVVTPRGAAYRLHNSNQLRQGVVNGTYIILELKDAAGNKLSGATKIFVATRGPADEAPKFHRALPYANWRDLSTADQRDERFKATLIAQTDLNTNAGIEIPEGHELLLYAEGPQVVDWTKSFVNIDFQELN